MDIKFSSKSVFLNSNNLSGELKSYFLIKLNLFHLIIFLFFPLDLKILASRSLVDVFIKRCRIIKIIINKIIR